MPTTIRQTVSFSNTSPDDLYELYMDSKKHSIATAAPAKISEKEGGVFSAHDGFITGKNLQLVKGSLIVQSWRGVDWDKKDIDSTFILFFEKKGKNTVLQMVHANIPDNQVDGIRQGWHDYYWKPWKKYLLGKPIAKPKAM